MSNVVKVALVVAGGVVAFILVDTITLVIEKQMSRYDGPALKNRRAKQQYYKM